MLTDEMRVRKVGNQYSMCKELRKQKKKLCARRGHCLCIGSLSSGVLLNILYNKYNSSYTRAYTQPDRRANKSYEIYICKLCYADFE